MTACEVAWSRLPQAGMQVHRGLLYDQMTPTTSGARGLATGSIYTHDGQLAITVVQEGLIRRERS